ncbi:MFS transporter [Legionella waltersii]|uniref:2-acylglycerophosphoethanolamine acyltransferase n=1 Tax=Legionella waltersii TaxID=66969 RepID=A0A0W1AN01_9GAMM|nr:MFS transporter [Legionella waltersii]KTD82700.1 2-acylglycerophosphoethanolamine acyltransferase [Legionella waltersii]SNV03365.1 2-acylglycerophosphoethanolamine acyltransferase [Legionella waltersii]
MASGFVNLLKRRAFLPLFLTQFFGAFNDNAYKLSMLTMISYQLSTSQGQSEQYQAIAGALFILPFFLFSATSGQFADKYDKAFLTRMVKVLEVLLMICGGIAMCKGSIFFMMLTLTGMGIHSTFFGPIKYAILPDHLAKQDLLAATGLIEASTFVAILLGTTLGTLSIGTSKAIPYLAIIMTLSAAGMGLISSLFIPSNPVRNDVFVIDYHIGRATLAMLQQANEKKGVMLATLTISWFWFIGAVLMTKLPDYTHYVLGANTTVFAIFLALFSIGIAIGSLMINCILKGRVRLKGVPLAMLAFSVFNFDLYLASPPVSELKANLMNTCEFFNYFQHWRIAIDLFMLAFCAGLFVVPLYTYLQVASSPSKRARTIAANNVYNALFMVFGSLLVMGLLKLKITIPQVFLVLCLLNISAAGFVSLGLRNPITCR